MGARPCVRGGNGFALGWGRLSRLGFPSPRSRWESRYGRAECSMWTSPSDSCWCSSRFGAIAAIVTGALAGGYVVGRWGPTRSVPMGALSGLIAGALAALASAAAMGRTWVALGGGLSTVVAATSCGAIGAWAGACVRATSPGGAEILLDD